MAREVLTESLQIVVREEKTLVPLVPLEPLESLKSLKSLKPST